MTALQSAHVKVCGVTNVDDALACVRAGVASIGLNFVPASPRFVDDATARAIVDAVGDSALVVGVFARATARDGSDERAQIEALLRARDAIGLGCLQLHGDESPALVEALLPHAYKAVRLGDAADVIDALRYPGDYLLVDAKVPGALGGTGIRAPIDLAAELARARRLTLAGGLRPDNVAAAIAAVRPFCVDVASGVERSGEPRRKSIALVEAFVEATRAVRF